MDLWNCIFNVNYRSLLSNRIRDKKLLDLKTAERLSVKNLYEQMIFTNKLLSNDFIEDVGSNSDSNNQYFTYLSHYFDQYFIHMVSLGVNGSQNFHEVEDIWRSYLIKIADISEVNINELEGLEKQLLKVKNEINNEETILTKKIENYWWKF